MNQRLIDLRDPRPEDAHHADELAADLPGRILRREHESRPQLEVEPLGEAGAQVGGEPVARLEIASGDHPVVQHRELALRNRIDAQDLHGPCGGR